MPRLRYAMAGEEAARRERDVVGIAERHRPLGGADREVEPAGPIGVVGRRRAPGRRTPSPRRSRPRRSAPARRPPGRRGGTRGRRTRRSARRRRGRRRATPAPGGRPLPRPARAPTRGPPSPPTTRPRRSGRDTRCQARRRRERGTRRSAACSLAAASHDGWSAPSARSAATARTVNRAASAIVRAWSRSSPGVQPLVQPCDAVHCPQKVPAGARLAQIPSRTRSADGDARRVAGPASMGEQRGGRRGAAQPGDVHRQPVTGHLTRRRIAGPRSKAAVSSSTPVAGSPVPAPEPLRGQRGGVVEARPRGRGPGRCPVRGRASPGPAASHGSSARRIGANAWRPGGPTNARVSIVRVSPGAQRCRCTTGRPRLGRAVVADRPLLERRPDGDLGRVPRGCHLEPVDAQLPGLAGGDRDGLDPVGRERHGGGGPVGAHDPAIGRPRVAGTRIEAPGRIRQRRAGRPVLAVEHARDEQPRVRAPDRGGCRAGRPPRGAWAPSA